LTSAPELPDLVRAYVEPAGLATPRKVQIMQAGTMWQKPGGRARRFTAVQDIAVEEVAFSWRARFPLVPGVSLRVVDRYAAGAGRLEARLLGVIPIMRQRGPELAEGEALRYLSELAWAPQAMVLNRQLAWRELDGNAVELATPVGATRAAVRLDFDPAGDIIGASAEARPALEGKQIVRRPWAGRFADYATVGGMRIPTRAEVWWERPEGRFVYWAGTVTSLQVRRGATMRSARR
jgi:hypothetical protein